MSIKYLPILLGAQKYLKSKKINKKSSTILENCELHTIQVL